MSARLLPPSAAFDSLNSLWASAMQWLHGLGLEGDRLPQTVRAVQEQAQHLNTQLSASTLDTPTLLALAAALGWASGVRLYVAVFLIGAAGWLDGVSLPSGLLVLQHPLVLLVSGFMVLVEFFADKVPWLDSLWDGIHAFVRIPAGALLAAGVFSADSTTWALAAGLLGGSLSATALATKMTARAAVNTSPEPLSNWGLSLLEDGMVPLMLWMAVVHPQWFAVLLVVVLVLSVLLLVVLIKFLRAVLRGLRGGGVRRSGTST